MNTQYYILWLNRIIAANLTVHVASRGNQATTKQSKLRSAAATRNETKQLIIHMTIVTHDQLLLTTNYYSRQLLLRTNYYLRPIITRVNYYS